MKKRRNIEMELLAPAGSPEKLRYAIHYGADAVYCGIPDTSMRSRINAFTQESLREAADFVHEKGRKIFVTINIYAHNIHLEKIEEHLKFLKKIKVDGVIISDLGVLNLVKKHLPKVDIHISTQANTTNWQAAKFWYDLGAKRVVLAREVTLGDIREIHRRVPKLELEYFVHGAMCMSYSGRCILSKWMSGKSANLGDCSQPCRWGYKKNQKSIRQPADKNQNEEVLTMSVEDMRGEHEVELEEDSHGTYFFNSKDLNLLKHVKDLHDAGVMSFKIEGRNKSVFYVASVTRAYRSVLDAVGKNLPSREVGKVVFREARELAAMVNRGYTEGFLLENEPEHNFKNSHESSPYQFVGEIKSVGKEDILIAAHNAIYLSDSLEVIGRNGIVKISVKKIMDEDRREIASAHGGQQKLFRLKIGRLGVKSREVLEPMSLLRKVVK